MVGDVDFEGVQKKAGYVNPVPGSAGLMPAAMLMNSTSIAVKKALRLEEWEALKSKQLRMATY